MAERSEKRSEATGPAGPPAEKANTIQSHAGMPVGLGGGGYGGGDRTVEAQEKRPGSEGDARPQEGGEAATTRFGLEDGDDNDVAATGGVTPHHGPSERPS